MNGQYVCPFKHLIEFQIQFDVFGRIFIHSFVWLRLNEILSLIINRIDDALQHLIDFSIALFIFQQVIVGFHFCRGAKSSHYG